MVALKYLLKLTAVIIETYHRIRGESEASVVALKYLLKQTAVIKVTYYFSRGESETSGLYERTVLVMTRMSMHGSNDDTFLTLTYSTEYGMGKRPL